MRYWLVDFERKSIHGHSYYRAEPSDRLFQIAISQKVRIYSFQIENENNFRFVMSGRLFYAFFENILYSL